MSLDVYGGPADGESFACGRAPRLLRVVRSPRGKWDCLDLLDDEPRPNERVHLYELMRGGPGAFICGRGLGSSAGFHADGAYDFVISCWGELDEVVRDTASWREFAARYFGVTLDERGEQIADVIPLSPR